MAAIAIITSIKNSCSFLQNADFLNMLGFNPFSRILQGFLLSFPLDFLSFHLIEILCVRMILKPVVRLWPDEYRVLWCWFGHRIRQTGWTGGRGGRPAWGRGGAACSRLHTDSLDSSNRYRRHFGIIIQTLFQSGKLEARFKSSFSDCLKHQNRQQTTLGNNVPDFIIFGLLCLNEKVVTIRKSW